MYDLPCPTYRHNLLTLLQFKDNLLAKGKAGGTEAGRLLLQEITNELKGTSEYESVDIHVRIFANLHKLATVLQAADRIKDVKQFKEFALGFTQSREHLYFIDVGDGKEMVDSRVRGRDIIPFLPPTAMSFF